MQQTTNFGRARAAALAALVAGIAAAVGGVLASEASFRAVCVGLSVILIAAAGVAWKAGLRPGEQAD